MLLVALALAASDAAPPQILAGASFEAFATATERRCPQRQFRGITPADLDFAQQRFEAQLPPGLHRDLAAANHAEAACKGRNGLSCPTTQTLDAYRRTKMLGAFATFVCVHGRR